MTDPFSIALGCITIIESLNSTIELVRTYIHSDKSANRTLCALAVKLENFKGIIGGIRVQAQLEEEHQVELHLVAQDHAIGAVEACKQAIERIRGRLKTMWKFDFFGKPIAVGKVIDDEIAGSLKQFDDAMTLLQSALEADQRKLSMAVYENTKKTGQQVGEIARIMSTASDEKEKQALRDWLTTFDPTETHRSSLAVAFPGAGRWFLDGEFGNWIRHPEKKPRTLWLKGASGMGKTTLMSLAIECLRREHGFERDSRNLVAYFYCSSGLKDAQEADVMLKSFIKQLCDRLSDQQSWAAVRALRRSLEDSRSEQRGKASLERLQKTIGHICGLSQRVVLVLDSMNEGRDPDDLVKAITGCLPRSSRLQVLVSSLESVDFFKHLPQAKVVEVQMAARKVDFDIASFIHEKMNNEKGLRTLPAPLKQKIQDTVKERANGSFRWAECQIAAVRKARFPAKVLDALEETPSTLEGIYSAILSKFEDDEDAKVLTRKMLIWLTFSRRELQVDELTEAMCLDPRSPKLVRESRRPFADAVEEILQGCRDLVSYDANKKVAKLAHDSVRQFLLHLKPGKGPQSYYAIDEVEDAGLLCSLMLRYLNLPDMSSGHCPRDKLPERLVNWPLLNYVSFAFPSILEDEPWDQGANRRFVEKNLGELMDSASSKPGGGNFGSWVQVAVPEANFCLCKEVYPIYFAASRGYTRILKCVLKWQGNRNIDTPAGVRGSTPLHIACVQGRAKAVEILLKNGADVNERNAFGERGIEFAHRYGYKDIVKLLQENGARPYDTTIEVNPDSRDLHARPGARAGMARLQ
ncbi:uncharacterized protein J3D65DRAFT_299536 [Phyllosticta citribraziliensis]|uniref:Ankyrin repeat protein n=1 Tax=Phyllosticta citribraziliensis TaxID=989973 RepID=A0ABR1LXC3_9PEZI